MAARDRRTATVGAQAANQGREGFGLEHGRHGRSEAEQPGASAAAVNEVPPFDGSCDVAGDDAPPLPIPEFFDHKGNRAP